MPSFFASPESGLPTNIHFLNLPVILHFEPPNFLPLPVQEPVVFLLNISGLTFWVLNIDESMLPYLKVESNTLGECFGGRGRERALFAGITHYFKDDADLKRADLYLGSSKFHKLWR